MAMLGARRHYAVPRALHQAGLLNHFYTDFCSNGWWWRLARAAVPPGCQAGALGRVLARHVADVPSELIVQYPAFKLKRAFLDARVKTPAGRLRAYAEHNERFGRMVCGHGLGNANIAYVFNAAGREVAEYARQHGLGVALDQTAAPWEVEEKLLAEERALWTGWEFEGTREADWRPLADREKAEWNMADVIVCGSDYVVDGVRTAGGPVAKCFVVPYGVEQAVVSRTPGREASGPLRVLFAGTVQLRKGIQYLMGAARACRGKDMIFRAVGPVAVSDEAVRELAHVMEIVGPVPRSAMRREYEWADVLVLPSLSEGSANVTYEALACGLPVVTTRNAGSVVRDGLDGFIVPLRSADAISDRLAQLAQDRNLLRDLAENALRRAREYSWARYVEQLMAAVQRAAASAV